MEQWGINTDKTGNKTLNADKTKEKKTYRI